MRKNGKVGGIAIGVVLVLVVFGFILFTTKIPAGYAGIVYNMNGGLEEKVLTQGWKLLSPTKTVTKYTIAREQSYMSKDKRGDSEDDESFEIPTKEGASLEVDVAFGYTFDINRLPETFSRFRGQDGKEILDSFIKPNMQGWIKEITPRYGMIEIVSKERGTVNAAISEEMQKRFDKYGIIIDSVSLTDVRPDEDTDKAIKKKIKAQEELETAKVTAETDKVNAERDKAVALINAEKEKEAAAIEAEKAKIKAEGAAAARETESKAEAEAIKVISGALTDEYNEYIYYKSWNGAMPQITGGATPIIDMRGKE
jgi:regulator of protease activity HflC (stomatin/prohibitin superfamily)